ncbi:hypothetical protein PG994_007275 [Apiospora phragmitis]|uniref:Uncharacterized protein n=1 Tax=Apiospora phragmitis TaxID=2905665 RepID=A0ABR1V0C1_9PEZI
MSCPLTSNDSGEAIDHLLATGILSTSDPGIVADGLGDASHHESTSAPGVLCISPKTPSNGLEDGPPKKQPPMFWKAFGFALKQKFTISGSLYDDERALFLAEPNEAGIPDGAPCPQEATNYELFATADTMQTLNRLTFSRRGDSYFEFMGSYLRQVGTDNADEVAAARGSLEHTKAEKDRMWAQCCQEFANLTAGTPPSSGTHTPSFISFLTEHPAYNSAWNNERDAAKRYYNARAPKMSSLSQQLELLRLAAMHGEPQKGPMSCNGIASSPNAPAYDGPYDIPLAGIWDHHWADLGHPLLDQAAPNKSLTVEQKDFINSLTATVTFLQQRAAYAVNTGLWGVVGNPRNYY